jgi:hypothetical protein
MKVIRPLDETTNKPTIFLAGPIQSAPDWHSVAIKNFEQLHEYVSNVEFDIASPKMLNKPEEFYYDKQVAWESKNLANAAAGGVILFWLANPIPEELDPQVMAILAKLKEESATAVSENK